MTEPTKRRRIGTLVATHTGAAAVSGFAASIFTAQAAQNEALLEVVKQAGIGGAMVTLCLGFSFAILQTRERHHREESAERSATFATAFTVQGQAHEKDRAASSRIAEALGEVRGVLEAVQALLGVIAVGGIEKKEKRHGDEDGGKSSSGG